MRFVKREWGFYITLLDRRHFKVKLLWFRKFGECSMQKHEHRAEVWGFLWGRGAFYLDGDIRRRMAGDYDAVPTGKWHQFTAVKNTLVLELQFGEKCDEKDIIRA